MKNLLLLVITSFFFLPVFAQEEISNSITKDHIQIEGTKIRIVPPEGFTPASSFDGLEETESSSSIVIVTIPQAIPISDLNKNFTSENLARQGVQMEEKNSLTLNGKEALLIKGTQSAFGITFQKYILIFGGQNETFIVNGIANQEFPGIAEKVLTALKTVILDANIQIDPLAEVDFTIDLTNSKFQFAAAMANMLAYSVDGEMPTQSEDKSNFMAGSSLGEVVVVDPKKYAVARVEKIDNCKAKEVKKITIDGLEGYEIVAYGKETEEYEAKMVYQVMLYVDNAYYIMAGTAKTDYPANLENFKALARTFKRK